LEPFPITSFKYRLPHLSMTFPDGFCRPSHAHALLPQQALCPSAFPSACCLNNIRAWPRDTRFICDCHSVWHECLTTLWWLHAPCNAGCSEMLTGVGGGGACWPVDTIVRLQCQTSLRVEQWRIAFWLTGRQEQSAWRSVPSGVSSTSTRTLWTCQDTATPTRLSYASIRHWHIQHQMLHSARSLRIF
jgi:hypothetical protein